MLMSDNTLSVLKNFSSINVGMWFKKGNVLKTMNTGKTIVAEAVIDEQLPGDFGVHELPQLLSILSLHKSAPDLTLNGNDLIVSGNDGRSRITYRTCEKEAIKGIPEKSLTLPEVDLQFTLEENDFNWVMRSAAVLSSPNISIVGEGGKIYIKMHDQSNDSAHTDSLEVGEYTGDSFNHLFRTDNWKMMPATYDVKVASAGIVSFENTSRKIMYWVALEKQ